MSALRHLALSLSLGCALLGLSRPGLAGNEDDEFMAGEEDEPTTRTSNDRSRWTWPEETQFDTASSKVSIIWTSGEAAEQLEFDDILRVERARAYEGVPEELFLSVSDGRRILVSRGEDVTTHAALVKALLGLALQELAPGEGHFENKSGSTRPAPRVRVGPGEGILYKRAAATDLSLRGGDRSGAELRMVAPDAHPALSGEGGGKLEKHEIDLVVKERMALFSRCYERELRRDPNLAGKVVIRFVVNTDGSVKHAHLRATSMDNGVVENCVVSEVLQTRFPRPTGGATVIVSYPFNFQPR